MIEDKLPQSIPPAALAATQLNNSTPQFKGFPQKSLAATQGKAYTFHRHSRHQKTPGGNSQTSFAPQCIRLHRQNLEHFPLEMFQTYSRKTMKTRP
jgi:hypothetical protein